MVSLSIWMVEQCAAEKLGRPDAVPIKWERLDLDRDGITGSRVTLVDPDPPLVKTGPRKGRPNWAKATNRAVRIVTDDEAAEFAVAWSARTGGCIDCSGTGELFVRWSAQDGTTMRPCEACEGTGRFDRDPDGEPPRPAEVALAAVMEGRLW